MYRTKIRSFFLVNRRSRKVRFVNLDAEMSGCSDEELTKDAKDSLNSGVELSTRGYRPNGPLYYLINSIFKEYQRMIEKIRKNK